jgi:CBS domain-containing protein
MTRKVITVDQEANIFDAQKLILENHIRHLPVVLIKMIALSGLSPIEILEAPGRIVSLKNLTAKKIRKNFPRLKLKMS